MDFMSKSSNSMQSLRSNKIEVRFKTTQKDGILLAIGKANDFFTLELFEGYLRAETNVGGGEPVTFWCIKTAVRPSYFVTTKIINATLLKKHVAFLTFRWSRNV